MTEFNGWEKTSTVLGKGGQGLVTLVRRPEAASRRSKDAEIMLRSLSAIIIAGPSKAEKHAAALRLAEVVNSHKATDTTDQVGALKEFFIKGDGDEAKKAMGRLEQEIEALRDLDEPGILRLLKANAGERWMVTEYHPSTLANQSEKYKGNVLGALARVY